MNNGCVCCTGLVPVPRTSPGTCYPVPGRSLLPVLPDPLLRLLVMVATTPGKDLRRLCLTDGPCSYLGAVRGDLIRILTKLLKRRNRLDAILIETTGLADPAPVAQTFFVDEEVKEGMRLDSILTVVDAKHIVQHLDEKKEQGVINESSEPLLPAAS